MKKNLFFAALAITALVSCSESDYLGDEKQAPNSSNDVGAISFGSGIKKTTRADWTGAAAADKLNNNFVFLGTKTVKENNADVLKTVFDHYNANWYQNTANTTESNSNDWEYVGYTPASTSSLPSGATQSIKYWDYAASQYDFAAYSLGYGENPNVTDPTNFATATKLDFSKLGTNNAVYTLSGTVDQLKACYVSDLVTHYNISGIDQTEPTTFGKVVNLSFRSLGAKIRLAFYETVPGYSVKEVKFYTSANATLAADDSKYIPTLFTGSGGNTLPSQAGNGEGTMSVYFPTTGWDASPEKSTTTAKTDYNKALVKFVPKQGTSLSSTMTFEALDDFANSEKLEDADEYLGRTSNAATYAGGLDDGSGKYYTVLPNEKSNADIDELDNLMIRIKYTLVSIDGSDEEITVDDAKAVIPKQFANWHPNYAYTYIFKISNMTNGTTGVNQVTGDPEMGLTPITLNAVVVESEDGIQETITTVADPSITTYMAGKVITDNDEYITTGGHPIYIVVNDGDGNGDNKNVTTLSASNAKLYIATVNDDALQTITEKSVDNALRYGVISGTDNNIFTVTDANDKDLVVTEVGAYDENTNPNGLKIETGIPADESPTGDAVTLPCASFVPTAPASPATVKYYVFQYKGDAAGAYGEYTAVAPQNLTTGTYYTLAVTEQTANGSESAGNYYQKDGDNYVKMAAIPALGTKYYTLTPTTVDADGTQIVVASGTTDYVDTYYTKEDTYVPVATALTSGNKYFYYDPTNADADGNGYVEYTANGNDNPVTGGYYIKGDTYKVVEYKKLDPGTYYTSNRGAGKFTVTSDNIVYVDAKNKYYTETTAEVDGKYMYKIIKVVP